MIFLSAQYLWLNTVVHEFPRLVTGDLIGRVISSNDQTAVSTSTRLGGHGVFFIYCIK